MKKLPLLLLILMPLSLFAFHDHEDKEHDHEISALENFLNASENKLKIVYDALNKTSKVLDENLTGEKSDRVYENSYIHFMTYVETVQDGDDDAGIDVKVKIRLPHLKNKFKLVLENQDNKIAEEDFKDSNETVPYQDDNFNLEFVQEYLKKNINLTNKIGVKLSHNPYLFASTEAYKIFVISDSWDFHLKEKLKVSTRNSLENTSGIEFHKFINSRIQFLNHNEYYWNEKDRDNNIYTSLRINQKVSTMNILNYVTSLISDDKDGNFRRQRYDTYVSYKHYIRKWLYWDIVPRVFWSRNNDFDAKYALRFNIGIVIGK